MVNSFRLSMGRAQYFRDLKYRFDMEQGPMGKSWWVERRKDLCPQLIL